MLDLFLKRSWPGIIPLLACVALACSGCASSAQHTEMLSSNTPPVYDYPFDNPYAATIIGTPAKMKVKYAAVPEPDERVLRVFPDRDIPEGFWYYDGLLYGEMLQHRAAPLVFIVGGTGSGYKSRYTQVLARTLYHGGYHVVMLPSPTHTNFIVTASSTFFPGNAASDTADLYRVMRMIKERTEKKVSVTSYAMTGFSLGAWNAAFIAEHDSRVRQIGFGKVLLINPPLDLYTSVRRLDDMLLRDLPGGVDDLDRFLDDAMRHLSRVRNESDALDFGNEDFLNETYGKLRPSEKTMATTIGLSFRLSAADMVFTSDVMSRSGYIFPKDKPFTSSTPLRDYLPVALRTGFVDYYKDIYADYYTSQEKGLTADTLARRGRLSSIAAFIASRPDIALITNRDDIILGPGEIDTLAAMFRGRSHIFPSGGHLGNIEHPAIIWQINKFFGAGS